METIRRELTLVVPDERVAEGGLKIYTTLDPDMQPPRSTPSHTG